MAQQTNVAAGTQQYYRPGMFDLLSHPMHGKGKHARAKKGTKHGIHGHGRLHGGHHDTLARGAVHDVWRNRDRMSGQR